MKSFTPDLAGGLMESLGQLFKNGAKLYVYPSLDRQTGQLVTAANMEVAPNLRHLHAHLVENRFVEDILDYNPDCLPIYSGDVLEKIQQGDESLANLIPEPIFELIRAKKLFGWEQKKKSPSAHKKRPPFKTAGVVTINFSQLCGSVRILRGLFSGRDLFRRRGRFHGFRLGLNRGGRRCSRSLGGGSFCGRGFRSRRFSRRSRLGSGR